MAVLSKEYEKSIDDTIRQLEAKNEGLRQIGKVGGDGAAQRSAAITGDSSILQAKLTSEIRNWQKFQETISDCLKSAWDAKMTAVRRIV